MPFAFWVKRFCLFHAMPALPLRSFLIRIASWKFRQMPKPVEPEQTIPEGNHWLSRLAFHKLDSWGNHCFCNTHGLAYSGAGLAVFLTIQSKIYGKPLSS